MTLRANFSTSDKKVEGLITWLCDHGAIRLSSHHSEYELARISTRLGLLILYRNAANERNWQFTGSPASLARIVDALSSGTNIRLLPGDSARVRKSNRKRNERDMLLSEAIRAHSGYCVFCGKATIADAPHGHPDKATVDHFVPVSKGGPDNMANMVLACLDCNTRLGSASASEKVETLLRVRGATR